MIVIETSSDFGKGGDSGSGYITGSPVKKFVGVHHAAPPPRQAPGVRTLIVIPSFSFAIGGVSEGFLEVSF